MTMSKNEQDVDLTLGLGSRNWSVGAIVNSSSSGASASASASANANVHSKVDIPFAASDPLSELVWSPQNGLIIKCANSFFDIKPAFTRNMDKSNDKKMPKMHDGAANSMFRSSGATSSSDLEARCRNRDAIPVEKACENVAHSLPGADDEVASALVATNLMMLESSAENELGRVAGKDDAPTASRMCLYREKGKEKVQSDCDMWARLSNDDDTSRGSMESCNSKGLLPKQRSKRMREHMLETHNFTPTVKRDSSFVNWISSMIKGLSDKDPSPVLPTPARPIENNTGFHSVFQSLYNRPVAQPARLVLADGSKDNSCNQITLASTPNSPETPKCKRAKTEVTPPNSSLWITRLYTRNDRLENKDVERLSRASQKMASVFAKRLEALRQDIRPSEMQSLTCFYCGGIGHDLCKCPNLTAAELDDLLEKVATFDQIENSLCFCIRCFQLNHWAVLCPSRRSHDHLIRPREIFDAPGEEMFNAISKLRLSRADILRWMNSDVPLSHLNGFFLRLRVGKLTGDQEETTYYVASITSDAIENVDETSRKSILVDVGGIKSSVGSQYISNHDFLEDEIKAWWTRIVKNGCRIPTLDELKSKCQHRKVLNL